jgi:hypothetical protein
VIRGFDADHLRLEVPVVLMQVPEELELRRGRSDDEQGIGALEGARYFLEKAPGILGRAAYVAAAKRVPVEMVLRRQDGRLVGGVWMEMKDPGFLVINPGDRVGRHAVNGPTNEARGLCN